VSAGSHPYRLGRAALLTQHGKEAAISAPLAQGLEIEVVRVEGYDTDRLGTFTRDVPRAGTQLEAARSKAALAQQLSGLPWGLGSEGSFGPDPVLGMTAWNVELLVWLDAERRLEVVATAAGPETNYRQGWIEDWPQAEAFAAAVGFPSHALIVSPGPEAAPVAKGITETATLAHAFALAISRHGRAWLETDMRAHGNPTRMAMIARAARQLAQRLESCCPRCGAPGWWPAGAIPGRPCADCGAPTALAAAQRWHCGGCALEELRNLEAGPADPNHCEYCNP